MFDHFLITINQWMLGGLELALMGCFLWGLVSVLFSPCHLASIPLMVGYVAGQDSRDKKATLYAVAFTSGLFISIAAVGIICSFLGRMLGDISPYWGVPVGLIILWLGLDMLGLSVCRVPSLGLGRYKMRGYAGAFLLGLLYGVLSGACTFGFIAPILAIITIQGKIIIGTLLILMFALGHCLPIVLAGSSAGLTQRLLQSRGFSAASHWGRRFAALLILFVGIYIIVNPFI